MNVHQLVDDLVGDAQRNGGFSFTQTLLRVGGIERVDNFEEVRGDLAQRAYESMPKVTFCRWARHDDFLRFMWNLVECAEQREFRADALFQAKPTPRLDQHHWVTEEKVAQLVKQLIDARRDDLAAVITRCFPSGFTVECSDPSSEDSFFLQASTEIVNLYSSLLAASDRERKRFGTKNRVYRWPRFEVLEILANESVGLYGYRVYHSNGNHSEFSRLTQQTKALNIQFERDGRVNYFVGSLDDLRPEWRVGSKRLFEVGIEGRYNELGKWKPIVYEGPVDRITDEILNLDEDSEVQGALFYIYTTAHWVVEFAVRATIDLPIDNVVTFGTPEHPIRLWKVPVSEQTILNERLYDGWISVGSPTVDAIKLAISHIRVGMSRLAFIFDGELRWTLKYKMLRIVKGLAKPSTEDLAKFDEVLVNVVPVELDLAISWINAGRNAADPLTSFLCYFNAIESVVEGAWEGGLVIDGIPTSRQSKSDRLTSRRACIQAAFEQYFPHDPNTLATEVYFTCFKQLAKRRRDVAEQIWGADHEVVKDLFDRVNGAASLEDFRDSIAHGRISLLDTDEVATVRHRLPRLAEIAKAMIIRVLQKKRAVDEVSFWSGKHSLKMRMNDPRNTLSTTTLSALPESDWSLRSEWIGE